MWTAWDHGARDGVPMAGGAGRVSSHVPLAGMIISAIVSAHVCLRSPLRLRRRVDAGRDAVPKN